MKVSSGRLPVRLGTAVPILAWLALMAGGLLTLWAYETSPGSRGQSPATWPVSSALARSADKPTLLLFAHPRCPCTRATLAEFANVLSGAKSPCAAQILCFLPANSPEWTKSELCETARRICGAQVGFDVDGHEAERFGAETSGHVLLYDRAGKLVFSGGITPARGQTGANIGAQAVLAHLNSHDTAVTQSSVLGCSLLGASREKGMPCRNP